MLNIIGSIVICLLAIWLGFALGKWIMNNG